MGRTRVSRLVGNFVITSTIGSNPPTGLANASRAGSSLLSSLLRAQRNFSEALEQAHFAALYFSAAFDRVGAARVRWKIATIQEQLGEAGPALTEIRAALAVVDGAAEPELEFNLRHAEAFALARCARFSEASSAFAALASDYERHPWKTDHRSWLEGLIAAGLGQSAAAQAAFRAAREGFLERKNRNVGLLGDPADRGGAPGAEPRRGGLLVAHPGRRAGGQEAPSLRLFDPPGRRPMRC